jgi:hypothetical protein
MSIFTKLDKYPFSATGAAYGTTAALQFRMRANGLISFTVENFGAETFSPIAVSGNTLTMKIQDSDDGVAWADVGGATGAVVPMGVVKFDATLRPHWRVLAYGNTAGNLRVDSDQSLDLIQV